MAEEVGKFEYYIMHTHAHLVWKHASVQLCVVAMADCADYNEANLSSSAYKVKLRRAKAEFSRSRYL